MSADDRVITLGEDIAQAGGSFKATEGLLEKFGPTRVLDTPISETGFLGAAVGAAMTGLKPVVEIMFIEFLGVALDQLTTEAAMMNYLSGGRLQVPLTVRASVGAGLGFGAQHSQTLERWLIGTPGLKVATASGARTAYGLLRSAIQDPGPVVVLEPRALYGRREDFDPGDDAVIPLGRGELARDGADVSIVTAGQTVGPAIEAADASAWSADVIDLLTLQPWDVDLVVASVARTGRLVTVEENQLNGGWGADVVSLISTRHHASLSAPPLRITAPDVHVPYAAPLEERYLPSATYIADQVTDLISTGDHPQAWWETADES